MMNILREIYIIRRRERIPKVRARRWSRGKRRGGGGGFRMGVQVRCITSVGFVKGYRRKIRQLSPDISRPPPFRIPFLGSLSFGCVSEVIIIHTSNFRQNQRTLIVPTREIILCERKFNPNYYRMENAYSCFGITCDVIFSSRALVGTFEYSKSRYFIWSVSKIFS